MFHNGVGFATVYHRIYCIVVTVDATQRPVDFSICMLGLRTTFIMEDNGFQILVYNLRDG